MPTILATTAKDVFGIILLIVSCILILAIIGGIVYFGISECRSLWKSKKF